MPKTGVIVSDFHCGHLFGLTPPNYQISLDDDRQLGKAAEWQRKTWDWYSEQAKAIGHIDRLILNGDAIDGMGSKSGGTELITTDRRRQVQMAKACVEAFDYDAVTIIRGTAYHTGEQEDWEDVLADMLGTHAQDHAWLEYARCVIDIKHHIGSTSIPGNAPPSLGREAIWNLLWAEKQLQPRANIIIRSHLHTYCYTGQDDWLAIVTPALQGWTKYGGRRMSKTISFGFIYFEITDKGEFLWRPHLLVPTFAAAQAEQL
jgi:hypothetical protein